MIDTKRIVSIQRNIDNYFDTKWFVEDFVEGYKNANGIENRNLTEEEWEDFDSKMIPSMLKDFRETIIQEVNERVKYLF